MHIKGLHIFLSWNQEGWEADVILKRDRELVVNFYHVTCLGTLRTCLGLGSNGLPVSDQRLGNSSVRELAGSAEWGRPGVDTCS